MRAMHNPLPPHDVSVIPTLWDNAPADNDEVTRTISWLTRWNPDGARSLAIAMHELASWQFDDNRTEIWRRVIEFLPRHR
jgi:hypothetical protein